MPAVRAALSEVFRSEDDDTPVVARSRRDWIVDSALFLFAAVLAIATGVARTLPVAELSSHLSSGRPAPAARDRPPRTARVVPSGSPNSVAALVRTR